MKKILIVIIVAVCFWGLFGCDTKVESPPNNGEIIENSENSDVVQSNTGREMFFSLIASVNPNHPITASEFIQLFPSAVKRQTDEGYYYVCFLSSNEKIFGFSQDGLNIYKVRVFEEFHNKNDFLFVEVGETTYTEMIDYDENFEPWMISSYPCAAYYTTEGAVFITFSNNPYKNRFEYVVESIEYISNDQWDIPGALEGFLDMPYIYKEDKE